MVKVGMLVPQPNEIGQIEWRRVVSVNPVKYSGALAITKPGAPAPDRYPAVDKSMACGQCDGSGSYPEKSTEVCQKCGGNGRKKLMPMQKPHMEPEKPFRGIYELNPR